MTREQIIRYMNDPTLLDEATIEGLKNLVHSYNFCPTFIFLYLYNLYRINDLRYHSELQRLSIFLPHRYFLYQMIEDAYDVDQWKWSNSIKETSSFDIVEKFLEQTNIPEDLCSAIGVSDNYFMSIDVDDEAINFSPENDIIYNSKENTDTMMNSVSGEYDRGYSDDLLTEALARIYIKQQKYDKALRIIKSISLHYPEKNIYFADQIRFLERILNINKSK